MTKLHVGQDKEPIQGYGINKHSQTDKLIYFEEET